MWVHVFMATVRLCGSPPAVRDTKEWKWAVRHAGHGGAIILLACWMLSDGSSVWSPLHNLILGIGFCRFHVTMRAPHGGENFFSDSEIVTSEPRGGLCIRKVSASRKCQCCKASRSCSVSAESLSHSHFTFAIKCSTCPTSLEPDSFFPSPFFFCRKITLRS